MSPVQTMTISYEQYLQATSGKYGTTTQPPSLALQLPPTKICFCEQEHQSTSSQKLHDHAQDARTNLTSTSTHRHPPNPPPRPSDLSPHPPHRQPRTNRRHNPPHMPHPPPPQTPPHLSIPLIPKILLPNPHPIQLPSQHHNPLIHGENQPYLPRRYA